jgi:hypothetical protein
MFVYGRSIREIDIDRPDRWAVGHVVPWEIEPITEPPDDVKSKADWIDARLNADRRETAVIARIGSLFAGQDWYGPESASDRQIVLAACWPGLASDNWEMLVEGWAEELRDDPRFRTVADALAFALAGRPHEVMTGTRVVEIARGGASRGMTTEIGRLTSLGDAAIERLKDVRDALFELHMTLWIVAAEEPGAVLPEALNRRISASVRRSEWLARRVGSLVGTQRRTARAIREAERRSLQRASKDAHHGAQGARTTPWDPELDAPRPLLDSPFRMCAAAGCDRFTNAPVQPYWCPAHRQQGSS